MPSRIARENLWRFWQRTKGRKRRSTSSSLVSNNAVTISTDLDRNEFADFLSYFGMESYGFIPIWVYIVDSAYLSRSGASKTTSSHFLHSSALVVPSCCDSYGTLVCGSMPHAIWSNSWPVYRGLIRRVWKCPSFFLCYTECRWIFRRSWQPIFSCPATSFHIWWFPAAYPWHWWYHSSGPKFRQSV
jgi:hypothetical protein